METTVSLYDFREAFRQAGRAEQFSYEGLEVLFDMLESLEDDTGEEIELDVIALCCEYSEETSEEIAANYSIDISECEDEDEIKDAVLEYLNENTFVAGETATGIVYAQF
jgi:predicted ArsR family transcriptional regulator